MTSLRSGPFWRGQDNAERLEQRPPDSSSAIALRVPACGYRSQG